MKRYPRFRSIMPNTSDWSGGLPMLCRLASFGSSASQLT
jgi:hypothetical protein